MITVNAAKAILAEQDFPRTTVRLPLPLAVGRVLAENVYASCDIPAFNQSSMDGYAFKFADWQGQALQLNGVLPAGHAEPASIGAGQAARIFTGAPLPEGADTVVMQEQTNVSGQQLQILQKGLKAGDNMRPPGSEIRNGELAMGKDLPLTPAAAGFLAGTGCAEVSVYKSPSVAIIITGDELQQPGVPLLPGQVYEASSTTLRMALTEMGITDIALHFTKDDPAATQHTLHNALTMADVVLLTGGVSVGDYDFVVQAAARCGVQQLFHRVQQRPGKPLYAGRKGNQPVFGLPGNPSSVLTCFYQYVWPVLRRLTGHSDQLRTTQAALRSSHQKNHPLTHFLKAYYNDGKVQILNAQESYRMRSFAVANCFVALDETAKTYEENDIVNIYLLPTYE